MGLSLKNKRILLIVGGGIAAYKIPELIQNLRDEGAEVRCVLTESGSEFVTPLTLSSLSGHKVYQSLFNLTDEAEMGHIRLSREADIVLVAPITANLMAKMAQGIANDLASTTLLASDKPVVVAPAMNVKMWNHPATQRNVELLQQDGVTFIGPEDGRMACGEMGIGRMSEPEKITQMLVELLTLEQDLKGKKVIVTAGPTHEPIDPIRFIANRSSGKQGYAIADELAKRGADTILISGPTNISPPEYVKFQQVETAQEMLTACYEALPCDIAVMTAAVADWRMAEIIPRKIKKTQIPQLNMVENPDILARLAIDEQRPELLIGFAAETNDILKYGQEKLQRKKCDWIIANDVSAHSSIEGGIMGHDKTELYFISQNGIDSWGQGYKIDMAAQLTDKISDYFKKEQK